MRMFVENKKQIRLFYISHVLSAINIILYFLNCVKQLEEST